MLDKPKWGWTPNIFNYFGPLSASHEYSNPGCQHRRSYFETYSLVNRARLWVAMRLKCVRYFVPTLIPQALKRSSGTRLVNFKFSVLRSIELWQNWSLSFWISMNVAAGKINKSGSFPSSVVSRLPFINSLTNQKLFLGLPVENGFLAQIDVSST